MLNFCIIFICIILHIIYIWSLKLFSNNNFAVQNYCLIYGAGIGTFLGLTSSLLLLPSLHTGIFLLPLLGIVFGQALCVFFVFMKQAHRQTSLNSFCRDQPPTRFFITGDKHRKFDKVKKFCHKMNTCRTDILIILGDAGFNYYNDKRDNKLKKKISQLNITLFCLHGNKENRPQNVGTYGIRSFCGGKVYYEPKYPNIYFAMDGEIYTFEGKKYMVVGGAHSVDKMRCLEKNAPFWYDEIPGDTIKDAVECRLQNEGNKIYGMMTHTCPINYLPTEMFVSTKQNAGINKKTHKTQSKKTFKPDIDRSTEMWLGNIEKKIDYEVWFCGHFHIDKQIDKIQMMYHDIRLLHN